jgi:hypothetical protein
LDEMKTPEVSKADQAISNLKSFAGKNKKSPAGKKEEVQIVDKKPELFNRWVD